MEDYFQEVRRLRRWFHEHAELSMEERETSRFIYEYLKNLGIPCERTGETGVIGTLMADPGLPTVAVRAEIDALPICEDTGLSFSSVHQGVMHACGHDAIAAVVLCLAKASAENRDRLRYNVRFLFEPGEEVGQGARYMIRHGGLENPAVDQIWIFHFANQETRGMEIQRSITTAAVGGMTIRVRGKSSHWFQWPEGRDALYAAARTAVEIRNLNQSIKTEHPFVLGFGLLQAGTAGNIVADQAVLNGSLRAFTKEDFRLVWEKLEETLENVAEETGTEITLEQGRMIPPMINAPELVEKGAAIGRELMGSRFSLGEKPFLVGDNAAYYTEFIPGMRTVFLAGKEGEEAYPVHHGKFDIDEAVLEDAFLFFCKMLTKESHFLKK